MADDQLNRERRALLGAALGLPLVGGGRAVNSVSVEALGPLHQASPGPPPRAGEDWAQALAAFRVAGAAVAGEEGRLAGASFEDAEAGQAGYDRLCEALDEALAHLFAAHEAFTLSYGEEALAIDALGLAHAPPGMPGRSR